MCPAMFGHNRVPVPRRTRLLSTFYLSAGHERKWGARKGRGRECLTLRKGTVRMIDQKIYAFL